MTGASPDDSRGLRLLVIAPYPLDRAPNQRFRFEQYVPIFRRAGWHVDVRPLMSIEAYGWFSRPGRSAQKAAFLARAMIRRVGDVAGARRYDTVLIVREAFPAGPALFEALLRRVARRLVFDFDDAIWLPSVSRTNRIARWLKHPAKTARIIKLCDRVIAGNGYLARYASRHNSDVVVIPTTIDMESYGSLPRTSGVVPVVGWSGSPTTAQYLDIVVEPLRRLQRDRRVRLIAVGATDWRPPALDIEAYPWSSATEVPLLREFDVGLMPLTDDEWSRGKCGLKALQYMALETATVVSPVGVNTEIVEHGVNGLHAHDGAAWYEALVRLVDDPVLRARLGAAGRRTVVERYSVRANADRWLSALADWRH